MADATAVIQAQQVVVGRSLVGGAAAVAGGGADSEKGILEQIREISLKTFRAAREQVEKFADLIQIEKDKIRREREQAAERRKEMNAMNMALGQKTDVQLDDQLPQDQAPAGGGFLGGFLGNIIPNMKKTLAPFLGFFGKLTAFFGRLIAPITRILPFLKGAGPIGLAIGAIMLLFRYFDDIVEALKPAFDGISKLMKSLQPIFDRIMQTLDAVVKPVLKTLGTVLGVIFSSIADGVGGIIKIIKGIFTLDGSMIIDGLAQLTSGIRNFISGIFGAVWQGIKDLGSNIDDLFGNAFSNTFNFIMSIPEKIMNGIRSIGNTIGDFFTMLSDKVKSAVNSVIDSLPLPNWLKEKMKLETSSMKAERIKNEASEMDTQARQVVQTELSGELDRGPTPVYEDMQPKTINMDQPTMAKSVRPKTDRDVEMMIENFKKTREGLEDIVNKYGFGDFMVGDPEYEKAIAEEAEEMNRAMAGSGDAMMKAYARFSRGVKSNRQRLDTLNMGEFDERLKGPSKSSQYRAEFREFEKKYEKGDLSGQVAPLSPVTIVNQPINQASNASNTSNTVSSTPLKTITDPYFDRESYNGNY